MTNVVVGLDIGTSNIRVAIGEIAEDNSIEIKALSQVASKGVQNGIIVNIEEAIDAIKECVDKAEIDCGTQVISCITAIGGSQIESYNSHGLVGLLNKGTGGREITQQDKERALESARATFIPLDREFLHVIPRDYTVDGTSGIKDPINRIGVRLETDVHIVTASKTLISNIYSCVNRAGYEVDKVWLKTLAQVKTVVHQDELDLGSILIDLGAGSTDVLVLTDGAPACCFSIPIAQNYVTNDIAVIKGIPFAQAEKVKIDTGCCYTGVLEGDKEVLIPSVGGRAPELVSQREICEIIQSRMEEILEIVIDEIHNQNNLNKFAGNIILTGGGALMDGVVELTQRKFYTSFVRLGIPESLVGVEEYKRPDYATVIGLLKSQVEQFGTTEKTTKKVKKSGQGFFKKLFDQLF